MPSPLGHALGAVAVGWAIARPQNGRKALLAQTAALAVIGMAPDLDLLWGRHSYETHSIGAAIVAAAAVALVSAIRTNPQESYEPSWGVRTLGVRTNVMAFVVGAMTWLSHPVLDMLGADSSPPLGVMFFWPLSDSFFIAPFAIFDAISRMWWRDDVWTHNFTAAGKELLILGPIVAVTWAVRRRVSVRTLR